MIRENDYTNKGIQIVQTFLDNNNVNNLRNNIEKVRDKITETNRVDDFKEIYNLIFNEKLIKVINENFNQEVFVLNHLKTHIDKFSEKNLQKYSNVGGWHVDSGSTRNHLFLSKKNNILCKIGIYLQENKKYYGGGIDAIPNFNFFRYGNNNLLKKLLKKIYYFHKIRFFNNCIENNSGDMIIFDSQTFHRSSMKVKENAKTKMVIYFNICNKKLLLDVLKEEKIDFEKDKIIDQKIKDKIFEENGIYFLNQSITRLVEKNTSD